MMELRARATFSDVIGRRGRGRHIEKMRVTGKGASPEARGTRGTRGQRTRRGKEEQEHEAWGTRGKR